MEFTENNTKSPRFEGFVDESGFTYGRSDAGNVNFGDISRRILGQQCQYGSRYVDGVIPGYPDLSKGLQIEGSSADYHTLAVSPEHAQELIDRIIAYRGLQVNIVYNMDSGHFDRPTETQLAEFAELLRDRGLPLPYEDR